MIYASLAELAEYLGVTEADLASDSERLLELASGFVDYTTLDKIDPDNADHLKAAKLAVCAQVELWQETGDVTGVLTAYKSISLGSFSASRNDGARSFGIELAPRAHQALFMEGLLYRGVMIR